MGYILKIRCDSCSSEKVLNLDLVMFDTLTDGMLSSNVESFPKWFVEGMAQTSSHFSISTFIFLTKDCGDKTLTQDP